MQQTTSHSLGIIPISISKFLERFAFYGMRSILILYLVNQLSWEQSHASAVYGIFLLLISVLPLIGGLIGDLLLSTKTATIIGGFIQAAGCLILALPDTIAIYVGLFLISLGTGFINPNMLSMIGSLYKNRLSKLDAAMQLVYLCINLGAFIGAFVLALFSERLGFQAGFVLCGILLVAAQLVLLFSSNLLKDAAAKANIYSDENNTHTGIGTGTRVVIVIATILSIALFWFIYQLSNEPVYELLPVIEKSFHSFYKVFESTAAFSIVLVGTVLVIIHSFVRTSSLLKMAIGFILYALACGLIYVACRQVESSNLAFIILFSVFLQAVAELFISPIAYSLICQFGPQKFNATLLGANLTFTGLFSKLASLVLVNGGLFGYSLLIVISLLLLFFLAAIFIVLYFLTRQKNIS